MMIARSRYLREVQDTIRQFRIAAILGPRQCGKTTLARTFPVPPENYLDLENLDHLQRLANPLRGLEPLKGLVIIDEVQRLPHIYETLRVLADRPDAPAKFLILGSASPTLIRGVSESLAGRVGFVEMGGFDISETPATNLEALWLRGGLPLSYLSTSDEDSFRWRQSFVTTFLTRDLPQYGIDIAPEQLRRFWGMLAHYHGQTWNASQIGTSLEISYKVARRYLDILAGSFMMRVIPPWFENIGKRLRKAPKVYIRDSGILHYLMNVRNRSELLMHPRLGASWEGFAIEQLLTLLRVQTGEAYYYAAHGGAEVDLLLVRGDKRYGFEVKYSSQPKATASIREVSRDLRLTKIFIIYPGDARYPVSDTVEAIPLNRVHELSLLL